MISAVLYAIIALESVEVCPPLCCADSSLTTYLTIDSSRAHGNNRGKTTKEHFPWSRNRYKKPFAAKRTGLTLFGMKGSRVRVTSLRPTFIGKKDIMPTNGCTKPFVGMNLAKNRIHRPRIFSTRKWIEPSPRKTFLAEFGHFAEIACESFLVRERSFTGAFLVQYNHSL